MAVQADVHHPVLDLHVPAEVALQVELAGAVGALEGLAASVQVHVPQQVVHAVEGFPTDLPAACPQSAPGLAKALQSKPGPQAPLGLPPGITAALLGELLLRITGLPPSSHGVGAWGAVWMLLGAPALLRERHWLSFQQQQCSHHTLEQIIHAQESRGGITKLLPRPGTQPGRIPGGQQSRSCAPVCPAPSPPGTLHLKGFTGECTIMWVLSVCFCTKVLKQMWHW